MIGIEHYEILIEIGFLIVKVEEMAMENELEMAMERFPHLWYDVVFHVNGVCVGV